MECGATPHSGQTSDITCQLTCTSHACMRRQEWGWDGAFLRGDGSQMDGDGSQVHGDGENLLEIGQEINGADFHYRVTLYSEDYWQQVDLCTEILQTEETTMIYKPLLYQYLELATPVSHILLNVQFSVLTLGAATDFYGRTFGPQNDYSSRMPAYIHL